MDFTTLGLAILWLIGLSAFCFALMFWDKRSAARGERRIPERTLLLWAYLGGGMGAIAAQKRFRHKTVQEPFRTLLKGSLVVNALLLITLAVPTLREAVLSVLSELL